MELDIISLGKRLRNIRLRNGMTIEELSKKSGLSKNLIAQIERGEKKGSIESLVAISNVLEISIEDLLTDSLLFTNAESKSKTADDFSYLLLDCSDKEARVIIKNAENLKFLLKRYMKK